MEIARLFIDIAGKKLGDKLVSAIVFGSVAAGTERADSDIDLLLVIRNLPRGQFARRDLLDEVHATLDTHIAMDQRPFLSTVLKTPEEAVKMSPLYFDMTDRSVIILDRDAFFANVLRDVVRRLKKLGSVRKKLGDIEYWDLKPDYIPGEVFEI